jgi:hypothetical protein
MLAASAAPANEPDIKGQVQAIYDQIGQSIEKKDMDGVTKYSLADATLKFADGTEMTLKEWKERAQKSWANIKEAKSGFTVQEAKPDADGVVATYTEAHEMLMSDPKGKSTRLVTRASGV